MTDITPPAEREIDRALAKARRHDEPWTAREWWLMEHGDHQLEGLDTHDYCHTCRATFWRPKP